MPDLDCILFDFFGTLVDYSHDRAVQDYSRTLDFVRQSGLPVEDFLARWVASFEALDAWSLATGREFAMADVGEHFLAALKVPADRGLAKALGEVYVQDWAGGVSEIPGIDTLFARLAGDFRLGVITNTHHPPMVDEWLGRIGIREQCQVVVTSLEHGAPKPAPDIFHKALHACGAQAERTLYVGDSFVADYQGARGAGLHGVLVGQHARVPRAHSIRSVLDLPRALLHF